MEGIFALVVLTLLTISVIALIRPLPRLGLNTRGKAGGALFLALFLAAVLDTIFGEEEEIEAKRQGQAHVSKELPPPVTPEQIRQAKREREHDNQPPQSRQTQPTHSDAEKLTVISEPGWGEYENTLKRFTFLLKEFEVRCPPAQASPADMLAASYQKIMDIGLGEEEGLLALSNTLYRLTVDIGVRASGAQIDPPACSEVFAMYLTLRQNGQSPTEAREGVTAVAGALYGLVAE